MNKQAYLAELKAHDWTYEYASGPAYFRGQENNARLRALAESDTELKALWDAYTAFVWSGGVEPTIEESTPKETRTSAYNLQMIMLDAWKIARTAAKRFGGNAKAYFSSSLAQAWARAKAFLLATPSNQNDRVYFICVDINTSSNTRLVNKAIVDAPYTSKAQAEAALCVLRGAFQRPFIKASRHYNLNTY